MTEFTYHRCRLLTATLKASSYTPHAQSVAQLSGRSRNLGADEGGRSLLRPLEDGGVKQSSNPSTDEMRRDGVGVTC